MYVIDKGQGYTYTRYATAAKAIAAARRAYASLSAVYAAPQCVYVAWCDDTGKDKMTVAKVDSSGVTRF